MSSTKLRSRCSEVPAVNTMRTMVCAGFFKIMRSASSFVRPYTLMGFGSACSSYQPAEPSKTSPLDKKTNRLFCASRESKAEAPTLMRAALPGSCSQSLVRLMLFACTLGQKIGLVTINPVFIPMHEEQIQRYGLGRRIVVVKAIEADPALLVRAFTDTAAYETVLRQFRKQVEPLVTSGVEVIIPAGGLPSLLFSRIKNFRVGEAVVLNCIAVLAKMTELAVALHRFNGTVASRSSTFQKPSAKALKEFLEN